MRQASRAELNSRAVEQVLGQGMRRVAVGAEAAEGLKAGDHARMNAGGRFAVELLIDDGFNESLKGRLGRGEAKRERSGTFNEPGEFGVGGRERGDGFSRIEGELAGALGGSRHWRMIRGGCIDAQ